MIKIIDLMFNMIYMEKERSQDKDLVHPMRLMTHYQTIEEDLNK